MGGIWTEADLNYRGPVSGSGLSSGDGAAEAVTATSVAAHDFVLSREAKYKTTGTSNLRRSDRRLFC
jgi:hypothetical protein